MLKRSKDDVEIEMVVEGLITMANHQTTREENQGAISLSRPGTLPDEPKKQVRSRHARSRQRGDGECLAGAGFGLGVARGQASGERILSYGTVLSRTSENV